MVDFGRACCRRPLRTVAIYHRSRHVLLESVVPDQDGVSGVGRYLPLHDSQENRLLRRLAVCRGGGGLCFHGALDLGYFWRYFHRGRPSRPYLIMLVSLLIWLENLAPFSSLRSSAYAYPIVLALHVSAISLFGAMIAA